MFDQEKILEIIQLSKKEKWPYPQIFQSLKNGGVESYEVDVASHKITYYGHGKSLEEKPLSHDHVLKISPKFNAVNIQKAIQRNQAQESDYEQFLKDIAAAGVTHYLVDMQKRKIAYCGNNQEQYVEPIPVFT